MHWPQMPGAARRRQAAAANGAETLNTSRGDGACRERTRLSEKKAVGRPPELCGSSERELPARAAHVFYAPPRPYDMGLTTINLRIKAQCSVDLSHAARRGEHAAANARAAPADPAVAAAISPRVAAV